MSHAKIFQLHRISGIRMGLIFAEFMISLELPKTDTAKNKPFYTSLLRALEIEKIGLSDNLTHLPRVIFAKISRHKKFPIYGICNGRYAGRLKRKLYLQSCSKCHIHFIGFYNVPVQAPTQGQPFYGYSKNRPISVTFYDAHGDIEDLFSS